MNEQQILEIKEACSLLKIQEQETSTKAISHVITKFRSKIKSNKIPSKDLIKARNLLIQNLIEFQMSEKGRFEIDPILSNICSNCKGTGEIYKFKKDIIAIPCKICGGKGTTGKYKCFKCLGIGHIKRIVNLNKIDYSSTCKECKGTGIKSKSNLGTPVISIKLADSIKKEIY